MEATLGRSSRRLLVAVASMLVVWSVAAAQPPVAALTLKAAFLFNFAKFVEWPSGAMPSGPLTICVLDDPAIADELERTIKGQSINGRKVAVSRVAPGALGACHVLYLSGLDPTRARPLIDTLKNAPVLTVGDGDQFAQKSGGIIGFYAQDDTMHFAVNVDAVRRARLRLSSRLLTLAKVVKDEPIDR